MSMILFRMDQYRFLQPNLPPYIDYDRQRSTRASFCYISIILSKRIVPVIHGSSYWGGVDKKTAGDKLEPAYFISLIDSESRDQVKNNKERLQIWS